MPLRSTLPSLADCVKRDPERCWGKGVLLLLCMPFDGPSLPELFRLERPSSAALGRRAPVRDVSGLTLRAASLAGSCWRMGCFFGSVMVLLGRKRLPNQERRSRLGAECELAWGGSEGAGPASMSAPCSAMGVVRALF